MITNGKAIHLLVDFHGCDADVLSTVEVISPIVLESARISKATIIHSRFHQFEPVGVSGVVLIAESHFAFHTWPEENYAAFDIFTCGPTMNVDAAVEYLKQHLSCKDLTTHKIERGVKSGLP